MLGVAAIENDVPFQGYGNTSYNGNVMIRLYVMTVLPAMVICLDNRLDHRLDETVSHAHTMTVSYATGGREAIAEKKAEKIRDFSVELEFSGGDIDN